MILITGNYGNNMANYSLAGFISPDFIFVHRGKTALHLRQGSD